MGGCGGVGGACSGVIGSGRGKVGGQEGGAWAVNALGSRRIGVDAETRLQDVERVRAASLSLSRVTCWRRGGD